MNKKINTIVFIFLLIFLISAVSAADNTNETITGIQKENPNAELSKLSVENENTEKLELEKNEETLSATQNTAKTVKFKSR